MLAILGFESRSANIAVLNGHVRFDELAGPIHPEAMIIILVETDRDKCRTCSYHDFRCSSGLMSEKMTMREPVFLHNYKDMPTEGHGTTRAPRVSQDGSYWVNHLLRIDSIRSVDHSFVNRSFV